MQQEARLRRLGHESHDSECPGSPTSLPFIASQSLTGVNDKEDIRKDCDDSVAVAYISRLADGLGPPLYHSRSSSTSRIERGRTAKWKLGGASLEINDTLGGVYERYWYELRKPSRARPHPAVRPVISNVPNPTPFSPEIQITRDSDRQAKRHHHKQTLASSPPLYAKALPFLARNGLGISATSPLSTARSHFIGLPP